MMLFYVCSDAGDDRGDDIGNLISAPDAATAASMWKHYHNRDDPLIFRVPPVSPTPMIHPWHTSWALRGAQEIKLPM